MNTPASGTTTSQHGTGKQGTRNDRRQQIVTVLIVVAVIIASGVWLARSQGAGDLGGGGVNSHLLPKVGEPAPEFMTLYARGDNKTFRLSDLKGQPVWLNFWGSWCPPCRAEMPELQAAWEVLEPRGLVMIGASMQEDPRDSVAYAERVGATFPITVDPNYLTAVADPEAFPELFETAETWQIRNFPTHVFIDREGIVRAVVIEQMDTETAISYGEMILDEMFKEKTGAAPTSQTAQVCSSWFTHHALLGPRVFTRGLSPARIDGTSCRVGGWFPTR